MREREIEMAGVGWVWRKREGGTGMGGRRKRRKNSA